MDYLFPIILLASILGFIFYLWKTIKKRTKRNIIGLIVCSIPIVITAAVIWFYAIVPYRDIHANDKDYFGEYEFYSIEGKLDEKLYKSKNIKLVLKPNFSYTFTSFDETNFPISGKWSSCWTDDCQFGFNYNQSNFFIAKVETQSSRIILRIHKNHNSNDFIVVRKVNP